MCCLAHGPAGIGPRFFPKSSQASSGGSGGGGGGSSINGGLHQQPRLMLAAAGGGSGRDHHETLPGDAWLWQLAAGGGAAVRRSRGPATSETGVVLPTRILVDSETRAGALSNMSGCIPGYPCGSDRVFFQMGPIESAPPAGTTAWIFNSTG